MNTTCVENDTMNAFPEKSFNEKAVRLIDFLLRIASIRSKVIREITDYEKILWISKIPHEHGCFTQGWGDDGEHEADEWIEIENRREPSLPEIPAVCTGWINESSLRDLSKTPVLFDEIQEQIKNPKHQLNSALPEYTLHTKNIAKYPAVKPAWESFIQDKWLPWAESYKSWEKTHKVYSELFGIHQEQMRIGEEFELILGIGLLTWQNPMGIKIKRHLLVANSYLEFEASISRFTVRPHPEGAKLRLELDMMEPEDMPANIEERVKTELAIANDSPWEEDALKPILQGLVHSINPQGEYAHSIETKVDEVSSKPILEFAPALILRKRSTKGLTEALKKIKEQIEAGGEIPTEFLDLSESSIVKFDVKNDDQKNMIPAFDGEVFFPKLSNPEQRLIVQKIRSSNGVLVQGPPGTGKSHTIANLISHLLATGQRTLITAKTPRALQVLERLVPEDLRPLCINLLGSGQEERRSLESSVGGILRKKGEWDEKKSMATICRGRPKRVRETLLQITKVVQPGTK